MAVLYYSTQTSIFTWCPNDHGLLQKVLVKLWWVVVLIQHRHKDLCEAVFALKCLQLLHRNYIST